MTDTTVIDLDEAQLELRRNNPSHALAHKLIAAVETLRERVMEWKETAEAAREHMTELEIMLGTADNRAEAAEAHAVELVGALEVCEQEMSEAYRLGLVDSLAPKSEASSFTQAVSVARTALAATPADALERAGARDECVDTLKELMRWHRNEGDDTDEPPGEFLQRAAAALAQLDALGETST